MSQHGRPVGPGVNDQAPVTSSMFAGYQPDRNRQRLGPRIPLPTHNAVPVENAFTPSMTAGYQPDRGYKTPQITHLGWTSREPDVLSAAIEQTIGYHPDKPHNFPPRRGPSFFPWSGTTPFSVEQVIGCQPAQKRAVAPHNQGQQILPSVDAFSVEMIIGWHPDRNRQTLGPRIGLPTNPAPTHTAATFSVEMTIGAHPDRWRAFTPKNIGTTTFPSVELFQSESVIGSHPDTARFFKGPRTIGWQVSQTTQTNAPINQEMLAGSHPDKSRATPPKNLGWQQWVSDINPFSIDMTAGHHPDTARFFKGPRTVGWSVSQTTQTNAPFSIDMVSAMRPATSRAPKLQNRDVSSVQPIDVVIFLVSWAMNSNKFLSIPVDVGLGDNDALGGSQSGAFLAAVFFAGVFFVDE